MNFLKAIFTWWIGATIGARMQIHRGSRLVGHDDTGNEYYETINPRYDYDGRNRRFVIYKGYADASKVPAEWHGWLHGTHDGVPESYLPPARVWEVDYTPNETGTPRAYRPQGALEKGGVRARATGDYEAWSPDAS